MRAIFGTYRLFLTGLVVITSVLAVNFTPAHARASLIVKKDFIPQANPDNSITLQNRPVETKVLANDKDLKDVPLTLRISNPPSHGTATIIATDKPSVRYTPETDFVGTDQYEYTVCDRDIQCSSAAVTILVQAAASDPVSPDSTPPTVTWEAPVPAGEIYTVGNENVVLTASAWDNIGVVKVSFLWWNASDQQYIILGEDDHEPFELRFNTSILTNGWNQIFVRAVDAAGNSSDYPFIWLYKTVMDHQVFLPYARR